MAMTLDDIKACLQAGGFQVANEVALSNGKGTQLRLQNEAIVNSYHTGNFIVQGKNQDAVKECLGVQPTHVAAAPTPQNGAATKPMLSKVFVVYGHDAAARTELEAMLRRWKLEPLILDQLPSQGQTIIEKLEKYTAEVKFAVVLATPDDEGFPACQENEKKFRARQNVVLELDMMLTLLGRKNVAILMKQQDNMERPSDIQGLLVHPVQGQPAKRCRNSSGKGNGSSGLPDFCG
ncbi:DNA-binding protein [Xylella fastidiosa subsp. fastidiosa]|jgi:predicted nucleotide-binding protein|nr:nucleotide-binding protein [Xylella fastidiosa EB92.1]KAF0571983.1 DNA-binding protein [Xylella fastidiosa subsp. fastidiosa Mus-1]KGM20240.1 DNA-binding protein [Xylella fastidiosa]NBI39283.1 DNA-binding protein [Xylella fastidiosa subsp. fastidiosa]NMR00688.1 DNA-binding protein [Xylella fastidiosa]